MRPVTQKFATGTVNIYATGTVYLYATGGKASAPNRFHIKSMYVIGFWIHNV